jgi:hypothetical protein
MLPLVTRVPVVMALLVAFALCASNSARGEDDAESRATAGPKRLSTDVPKLLKDLATLAGIDAAIISDRAKMVQDGNTPTSLSSDVSAYLSERSQSIRTLATNRKNVAADVTKTPALIFPKRFNRTQGLDLDALNYINDYDVRVAAQSRIDVDGGALKLANLADGPSLTTNANAYQLDRHTFIQARIHELADIYALQKDVKLRKRGRAQMPQGRSLLGVHVQKYLSDRTQWLADLQLVDADRNNVRAAVGTGSLSSAVVTFLTDRHQAYIATVRLALDRNAMTRDIGLRIDPTVVKDLKQFPFFAAESSQDPDDVERDQASSLQDMKFFLR